MSFNLLTVFIILVVLSGLGLVAATIMIQPMRESLVSSTNMSVVDKAYLSAFLGTIAELIKRFILPVIPFAIIGVLGLLIMGLPFTLDIQLGSSIDNKLRAPYRNGSQDYKYQFIRGGCGLFCSSNMKYNVKVHGNIHGIPPQIHCLENKPTFECHPSVDKIYEAVIGLYDE